MPWAPRPENAISRPAPCISAVESGDFQNIVAIPDHNGDTDVSSTFWGLFDKILDGNGRIWGAKSPKEATR